MKRILVLLTDYYPIPSSNTNCLEMYLKYLESHNWHVDILTRKVELSQPEVEEETNTRTIYRIIDYKTVNSLLWKSILQNKVTLFLRYLNKILEIVSKTFFRLHYGRLSYETYASGWDKEKIEEFCKKIFTTYEYNVVMSVSFPFITHEIAKKIMTSIQNNAKWVLFEFDPFSYNVSNYGKNAPYKLASIQHEYFNSCDKIFCTPQLYNFYLTTPYSIYKEKMVAIEYSNLIPVNYAITDAEDIYFNQERVNCFYCGVVKKDIRNPQYLFQCFKVLPDTIHMTIMTGSQLNSWKKILKEIKQKVTIISERNHDTACRAMLESNILINIGNTVVYQIPGKIFEYMSTGKPIIHFSKFKQDPCIKYLEKYPLALIVKEYEESPLKTAKDILAFCSENKNKAISYDDVVKKFSELEGSKICEKFLNSINII